MHLPNPDMKSVLWYVFLKLKYMLVWHDLTFCQLNFRVLLKKSGSRMPRVELEEMGPFLDLVLRRTHLASDDLTRTATRLPKVVKVRILVLDLTNMNYKGCQIFNLLYL